MRILASLLITSIFSFQTFAADVQEAFGMAAYYQFKTSDAAAYRYSNISDDLISLKPTAGYYQCGRVGDSGIETLEH
ncbi:hypothetical protein N9506_05800 [Pseudomonadales bacterium]|jgi:hypothetical protein|nr:hypothetical protein [Pseudomonadales bacterium]MDC1314444.1 hypothetical protein [Pseudomonadales bacterium]